MHLIKNFHSLPSFYLLILFATGISISWFIGSILDISIFIILFILNNVLLFFIFKNQTYFPYFSAINFLLAGIIYGWFSLFSLSEKELNLFEKDITAFQGTIVQVDKRGDKKDIYLMECSKIIQHNKAKDAEGLIVINQGKFKGDIEYGDLLKIEETPNMPSLPTNPGEFNYRKYLQLNKRNFYVHLKEETQITKIFEERGNWVQSLFFNPLRNGISSNIDRYLTGQSAAIVKALILGDKGSLDSGIVADFQKTGVIHVLAISGLHVGFIALILQLFLSLLRIPKKIVTAIVILFLVLFLALVNFKAPVVRASLMMAFYFLSKFIMRPQNPINVVALAAIAILLVSPEQLFLPGFQYSFIAVFGLIYGDGKFSRIIHVLNEDKKWKKLVNKYLIKPSISSLSAILATVPLTWYYFGSLQVGAMLANIFVIPLIGLVVLLSIIFLVFSLIYFLPAAGVALVIEILIFGMIKVVSSFAKIPFVQIITGHPPVIFLIIGTIGIFLLFNISKRTARIAFVYLLVFALLLRFSIFNNVNKFKITFINVGQGDAALLQFPNGKTALIDAGDKGFGFDAGERYIDPVLKYYGVTKVNYLIGSHPHSDHIGGFDFIMRNYPVDTLIFNEVEITSTIYKDLLATADDRKIPIKRLDAGDILSIDHEVRVYTLQPTAEFEKVNTHSGSSVNNSSLILKFVHGKNSILFNGDAELESEHELAKYKKFLDCDLLKVGHHGSKTSSGADFLSMATPDYAVISVGRNNKFNHPSKSTLIRYSQLGVPSLRTDLIGAVIFESDGKKLTRIPWR